MSQKKWKIGNKQKDGLTYNPYVIRDEHERVVAKVEGFPSGPITLEECRDSTGPHVLYAVRNSIRISLIPQMEDKIDELCRCLHDVATGRGGWAWEEVISEAQSILREIESGGLDK